MRKYFFFISGVLLLTWNQTAAQTFPTRKEIYDFQPGDVFHYKAGSIYGSQNNSTRDYILVIDSILNRTDSIGVLGDTVAIHYSIHETVLDSSLFDTWGSQIWTIKFTDTILTRAYYNLSDSIFTNCDLNDFACHDSSFIQVDTFGLCQSFYSYRKSTRDYSDMDLIGAGFRISHYSWSKGLGLTSEDSALNFYVSSNCHCSEYSDKKLVYYKKNGVGCGTALQFSTGIPALYNEVGILISPNPATTSVTISIDEGMVGGTATVSDVTGRRMVAVNLTTQYSLLNTAPFANGVYFVTVSNKEGRSATKKLVVSK